MDLPKLFSWTILSIISEDRNRVLAVAMISLRMDEPSPSVDQMYPNFNLDELQPTVDEMYPNLD